jgi:hypothetical protein
LIDMLAREYLSRLRAVSSFDDKRRLIDDMRAEENRCRELFAQKRQSWRVEGVEDPYLSLVWVHGEDPALMTFQKQVLARTSVC